MKNNEAFGIQNRIGNETEEQSSLLRKLKQNIHQLNTSFQQKKEIKAQQTKKLRQILQKKQFLLNEKTVQQKKYKSLNLLVNELQSTFEKQTVEVKSKQLMISDEEDTKVAMENYLLRQQLIKLNEIGKEDEKIYSFLKQLENNKNNLNNFIAKSNFIQGQAEILAQLKSSLKTLQNPNLECRRKWVALKKEKLKNQKDLKIFKIQAQRQKQMLKTLYQEYLQKINIVKTKIVNFNQTQRQKLLTQYLVQQVALIQQKRQQVEDENRNLHYHQDQLLQQFERIDLQNRQLNSFFMNDNRTQQSKLALKMKTRIQELRDHLLQIQNKNSIYSVINKRNANLEYVRLKLTKTKEANDYLELKQKSIEEGKFSHLDEKQIASFFTQILNSKDQKSRMIDERCQNMNAEIKELAMKQLLLQSQISNIEQVLKQNNFQSQFKKNSLSKFNFY